MSASAYYQRASGERSARAVEDERLLERIRELHAANYYAYGARRMWKALARAGEHVGRGRVERLMRTHGIQGAKRRGKPWRTTTPDPFAQRRPDLVQRDFTADGPNRLWVGDITYLRCWEGVVFFAFMLDAYSRRIVGWQFAGHMRTELVLDALRMAIHQRDPGARRRRTRRTTPTAAANTPASPTPRRSHDAGIHASVGSVGDAYDNALAETLRRHVQDRADRRPRLAHAAPSSSSRSSNTSPGSTPPACTAGLRLTQRHTSRR